MATLTVGSGEEYSTISAAVAASSSGDTIAVDAGTYTNDFLSISHDLTLQAVGGTVSLVATEAPPNGKGIIDEGGAGVRVSISGFDISGAQVPDGNGAGIRYEGGILRLDNVSVHDNQDGLLANPDPDGRIRIVNSTFTHNGAGDGYTHDIYVGDIARLTVRDSTVTDAVGGHDIKSRAEQTVIVGNRIGDSAGGTSGYDIDLPNGGNATIANNVIVKGADAQNPVAIAYGEEGNVHSGSSLTVAGNTLVNNETAHLTTAVWNAAGASATVGGNSVWGWDALVSGPADASGNTVLASDPLPGGISAAISSDTLGLTAATPATFVADAATGTGTATEATENAVALSADASAASLAPVLPAASDPAAAWTWSGGTSNLDAIGAAGSAADLAAGLSGQHAAILAPAAQTGAWA